VDQGVGGRLPTVLRHMEWMLLLAACGGEDTLLTIPEAAPAQQEALQPSASSSPDTTAPWPPTTIGQHAFSTIRGEAYGFTLRPSWGTRRGIVEPEPDDALRIDLLVSSGSDRRPGWLHRIRDIHQIQKVGGSNQLNNAIPYASPGYWALPANGDVDGDGHRDWIVPTFFGTQFRGLHRDTTRSCVHVLVAEDGADAAGVFAQDVVIEHDEDKWRGVTPQARAIDVDDDGTAELVTAWISVRDDPPIEARLRDTAGGVTYQGFDEDIEPRPLPWHHPTARIREVDANADGWPDLLLSGERLGLILGGPEGLVKGRAHPLAARCKEGDEACEAMDLRLLDVDVWAHDRGMLVAMAWGPWTEVDTSYPKRQGYAGVQLVDVRPGEACDPPTSCSFDVEEVAWLDLGVAFPGAVALGDIDVDGHPELVWGHLMCETPECPDQARTPVWLSRGEFGDGEPAQVPLRSGTPYFGGALRGARLRQDADGRWQSSEAADWYDLVQPHSGMAGVLGEDVFAPADLRVVGGRPVSLAIHEDGCGDAHPSRARRMVRLPDDTTWVLGATVQQGSKAPPVAVGVEAIVDRQWALLAETAPQGSCVRIHRAFATPEQPRFLLAATQVPGIGPALTGLTTIYAIGTPEPAFGVESLVRKAAWPPPDPLSRFVHLSDPRVHQPSPGATMWSSSTLSNFHARVARFEAASGNIDIDVTVHSAKHFDALTVHVENPTTGQVQQASSGPGLSWHDDTATFSVTVPAPGTGRMLVSVGNVDADASVRVQGNWQVD